MKADLNSEKYIGEILKKIHVNRKTKKRLKEDLSQDIEEQLASGLSLNEVISLMGEPALIAAKIQESYPYKSKSRLEKILLAVFISSGIISAFQFIGFLFTRYISLFLGNMFGGSKASIGIIGGADGPTAIFISSSYKTLNIFVQFVFPAIFVVSGIVYFILRKRKKKE